MSEVGRITAADAASIPGELVDAVVLADALQAFDLLHEATCGKAPLDELSAHYGVRNAHRIMQACEQIKRVRALKATTASSVGTDGPQSGPGVNQ